MKWNSKYVLRMTAGFIAYAVGLVTMNDLYSRQLPYRHWLIFLPVLPLIYIAATIVSYVSQLDEMWRKIATEAMAFSGIATGFSCFSYQFLRDMDAPEFRADYVLIIATLYYAIGAIVSRRRYT